MRPALLVCAAALAGCLREEARVESHPPAGVAASAGTGAVLTTVRDGAPQEVREGALPFDLPVLWSVRAPDGSLLRGTDRAESPLPWWQRFPCDLAIELWPATVTIAATASITPQPVHQRTPDEITAEARAHGYAR